MNGFVILAAAAIFMASASAASAPVTAAPGGVQSAKSSQAPGEQIQVADEIVRRLRRAGLNFNRLRLDRPYDPEGELC